MDFKQLKYFVATADFGNMTRAAQSVFVAQSAFSQQIANLEDEIGVRLFDRGKNGMQLTSAGASLYSYAKSILKQLHDAKQAVSQEVQQPHGRVAIGLPGSAGKILAAPLLRQLKAYPGIRPLLLERVSADLVSLIGSGIIDIALAVDADPQQGVKLIPLLEEDLYVISHKNGPWRNRSALEVGELARAPLILPVPPSTIRQRIDSLFLDAGMRYTLVGEVSGTDMTIHLVEQGLGWSVLPWSAVGAIVECDGICAIPLAEQTSKRRLALAYSESIPLSIAAEKALELLLHTIGDLVGAGQWHGVRKIGPDGAGLAETPQ
ncbi:LysR family transcriptional regulator [Cupriavidus sp. 30B13]|uniref:LysR family transcriptional regulator n=1 Tax=Cupriavidus sp. 30B13 TaxID=3384241 RepID=UPI003B91D0C7